MFDGTFITKNSLETQKLGKVFSKRLNLFQSSTLPKVIALYGELGSGKTTFVQGLAKELGIKKIISPTFIIVRSYKIRFKIYDLRIKNFYHIDLYRVESSKDIEELGIKELINDPENIVVIEWAERMKNLLPKERIDVEFEYVNEDKRRVTIIKRCHPQNDNGEKVCEKI